jgi:copper(I)-binding protein
MKHGGKTTLHLATNYSRIIMRRTLTIPLMLLSLATSNLFCQAQAQAQSIAQIHITEATARATAPKQANGVAYLQVENRGKSADKLLSLSSSIAQEAQIHTMSMDGDMMKMRPLTELSLPAGGKLTMKSGNGPHLMLMGLKQPLQAGQTIPITLVFEKAGKLVIQVKVTAQNTAR